MSPDRLNAVAAAVFGVNADGLTDDASPTTIPQWDSVGHLELVLALEAEFGVQFAVDEIATLNSLGVIRRRLAAEQ